MSRLPGGSPELLKLFAEVDFATQAVAERAGLACPGGCGRCCDNPDIWTTPAELVPLAVELVTRGAADEAYDRAQAADRCVFLDSSGPGLGRCSVYALRPMVCRLFGFAARRDKSGGLELAACAVHKQVAPEAVARARAIAAEGGAPVFAEWQERVRELDGAAAELMPLNRALQVAIERVSLAMRLAGPPLAAGALDEPGGTSVADALGLPVVEVGPVVADAGAPALPRPRAR